MAALSDFDADAAACPFVPVLTVDSVETAVPLGGALRDAGLRVLEITLRTEAGLDAIAAMKDQLDGISIGAGTITTPQQVTAAVEAGSDFLVSPGLTGPLIAAFDGLDMPIFPGVATPSEAMRALSLGFRRQKLFPAEQVGGRTMLEALGGPLAQISFMPTGGITATTAGGFLALDNVFAVGGSWMIDKAALAAGDWDKLRDYARQKTAL